MKKFTLLLAGFLFISITMLAQRKMLTGNMEKISDNVLSTNLQSGLRTTTTTTCIDTVQYTLENTLNGTRSFSLITQVGQGAGNYGEGIAQWFDARQPVTVKGFQFYGRAKYIGTTSNVTVSLYSSKADSTPNVKLATTTMNLDYVTGALGAYLRTVNFATPVIVTGPYLIAIEEPATAVDTFQLIINGNGDGFQEKISKVRVNGSTWVDVLTQSYGIDVDLLAYPIVSYNLSARYNVGGTLTPGSNVTFTNASSPILRDWFYNADAFYNPTTRLSSFWNLGEGGAAFGNAVDTAHVYATAGNYNAVLKDTLYGWTINCASDTTSIVRIGTIVPIKLVTYEARKNDNKVSIKWTSENELNSDYYVIERSSDGVNFTQVKKVYSSGGLQNQQSYTYEDPAPLDGINYYRLVQFDKDGRATYYGVRVVSFKDNIASLQVYPNPAITTFTIRTETDSKIKGELFISDAAGRIVKKLIMNASGVQTINTNDLQNGNYFIHLIMDGKTSTKSVLVNKR